MIYCLFVLKFNTNLAGAVGIEPTLTVLETAVLPLYDAPITIVRKPND